MASNGWKKLGSLPARFSQNRKRPSVQFQEFTSVGCSPSHLTVPKKGFDPSDSWSTGYSRSEEADGVSSNGLNRHSDSFAHEPPERETTALSAASDRSSIAAVRQSMFGRHPQGVLSISQLVDNECAKVLQSAGGVTVDLARDEQESLKSEMALDWQSHINKDKLHWSRKLARQLFQAFKTGRAPADIDAEKKSRKTCRDRVHRFLIHRYISALSLIFTLYALCAADISALAGNKAKHTLELACVNTVVLLFFASESVLHFIGVRGYVRSPQFCVDMFALMSMVGDTWIGYEVLKQDGAASGRAARILRMLRMGGRSSRFVRMVKNARLVQALRIMPRLWHVLNTQRSELRVALFHERLYRLFQCLDEGEKHYLTGDEAQIFHMALAMEFPSQEDRDSASFRALNSAMDDDAFRCESSEQSCISIYSQRQRESDWWKRAQSTACIMKKSLTAGPSAVVRWWTFWWRQKHLSDVAPCDPLTGSKQGFADLLKEMDETGVSKRIMAACEKDLQRVETSFSLVHEAGGRLTLKVSIIVLVTLILLPMLEVEHRDQSELQLLHQFHDMVMLAGPVIDCSFVQNYAQKTKHTLILLAVNMTAYFTPDCHCCDTPIASLAEFTRTWEDWAGLQPHELQKHCYEGPCRDNPDSRTFGLFDIHEAIRYEARMSLVYTSVVVSLLIVFVFFFTSDLRIFNERVLNPLWDLLDDMSAMKTVEFARGKDLTHLGQEVRHKTATKFLPRSQIFLNRIRTFFKSCLDDSPELEEMIVLHRSFGNFRNALRSWSKYVPIALVKKIVQSGIEVQLGVTRREVTVFFLDVNGFDDLCKGLEPREVLCLLAGILQEVSRIVERYQGTLLEFIGDEMLAVFNAPVQVLRHPLQGVSAAAHCLDHLAKLRSMSLRARIGVHSGSVLCGNLGSPMRLKYGMLGDSVNMTARLKSLNSQLGTRCLVSGPTLQLAETDVIVRRPLGRYILKGRTTPTEVWEVMGRTDALPEVLQRAATQHTKGFDLFLQRRFKEARALFAEVCWMLESARKNDADQPSRHLLKRCDELMKNSPPDGWDGSEKLVKK